MINKIGITEAEVSKLLDIEEGHFSDLKAIEVSPSKLSKTIAAFSNAEGGELFIGIEDDPRKWNGFDNIESANSHLQVFDELFPLGTDYQYQFLENDNNKGLVLKV